MSAASRPRARAAKKIGIPVRPIVNRLAPYLAPQEGRAEKLRLDFNENTIGCSPAALRALRRMKPEQLCIYPEYEASQKRLAKVFGVRPAEMLFTNGVDDALRLLMDTFIEPGSTVLLPEPTFTMYRLYAEIAGGQVVTERYDDDMNFPLEGILRALRRSPRLLCISNPNNPTATLVDRKALARILAAAPRTLVLVDEAYYEFAGMTVLPWIRRWKNLVVARTFSKAVGLAGLRLGALFACSDLADTMRRVAMPYPVNSAALVAAEAAMQDRGYLRKYVRTIQESRKILAQGLRDMGVRVFPSSANFLFVDFGPGGSRLVKKLAGRNILLRDRAGELGRDGFVRVTVGTPAQTRTLLRAIEEER